MQKLEVLGANKLKGQIQISGSKNASLPILAATLLSNKKVYLKKLPKFGLRSEIPSYEVVIVSNRELVRCGE